MKTYPLSESQLGIFYECIRNPQLTEYNIPCFYKYSSRIDPDLLEKALNEVFRAHPICYTRVIQEKEEIRQYMDMNRPIPIKRLYLKEAELDDLIAGFVRPFNLFTDPLLHVMIVQTELSVCLLLDVHHIITDGMSMIQLLKDLDKSYCGQPLEIEKDTFFDSVLVEKKTFDSDAYQQAAAFYKSKFDGVQMSQLPQKSVDGVGYMQQISLYVPADNINDYCVKQEVTPNLLFLAAYSLALSVFSGDKKVAFYTVNHGRSDKRFRASYGTFVKSAPVLSIVSSDLSVVEFIKSFRKELISMIRYGVYPFTHFCRDLSLKPVTSFAFQYNIEEKVKLGDEEIVLKALPKNLTAQNMSVVIYHLDDQYEIRLEYNDSRYEKDMMQHFVSCVKTCAVNMIKTPEMQLKDVALVTDEEQQNLLSISKGESIPWNMEETFPGLFSKQVQRTPENTAVVDHLSQLTYKQLDEQSDQVAAYLMDKGIGSGDFVGIMLTRRKEFVTSVLGILKAGAAYLPLASEYPNERLQYMLEDSEAKLLITSNDLLDEKMNESGFTSPQTLFIDDLDAYTPADKSLPAINPDQAAYMIYTSGSTGKPKGVVIQHRALTSFIRVCTYLYKLDQNDRIFCHSSFSFDASVEDLFPVLTCGGQLYILCDDILKEPAAIADYIVKNRLTGGNFTTQLGVEILKHYDLPLKYITVGGERLDVIPTVGARFFNSYGPTEFTVDATFFEPRKGVEYTSIPIGRPTPNSYAFVVNEYNQLVPPGCVGELCLSGPQMAKEYWKRVELTNEKFVPNPFSSDANYRKMYRTGDLVRWNSCNELEYIGRVDKQIKLRGFRIEIGEIEANLMQYQGIVQAVVDIKEVNGRKHLCAYYTTDKLIDENDLRSQLQNRLTDYMIPSVFIRMDRLPITPNGKTDYSKLPSPTFITYESYVAPTTTEEKLLVRIVQNILELDRVGVETDLFDIGLTSIQAMTVVFDSMSVGIEFSVSSLYNKRTIRNLLKEKKSLHYFWGSEYRDDKPVVILICGYPYYHPFYDNFVEYFKDSFSIFVFESYNEYFLWNDDVTIDRLFNFYTDVVQTVFKDIPIYAVTGFCFGCELAMLFAAHLQKAAIASPKVLIMEGYVERKKNEPVPVIEDNEKVQDYYRITISLIDDLPPLCYDGDIIICMASRSSRRLMVEFGEETDENVIREALIEALENKKRWKQRYPFAPYYEINADHWTFFDPEPLQEIKAIISHNWKCF